jgi:small-conductance mechanosensitive channel
MRTLQSDWDRVEEWLKANGTDILIVIAVLLVVWLVFRAIFPHIARAAMLRGAHPPDEEMGKRANTIIDVVDRTVGAVLVVIGLITILAEFGINVTAIITGLGIGGLALALGSQQLVRDTINGIFLLAEDQYRSGDVVSIAGVTGTVEAISLRRTILRDDDGVVHVVPNGSITVVSNHTRDYAVVNVEVRVSVGEDVDKVKQVIEDVGRKMSEDAGLSPLITDAPAMKRIESVGEQGMAIIVTTRTKPGARWDVAGELRRRLADAFYSAGINVPYAVVTPENEQPAGEEPQEQP